MSIITEIKKDQAQGFRRLYLKRRVGTDYEADWTRVPNKYIKNFGSVNFSIDDVKINFYKYSGLTWKGDNYDGYLSDIDDDRSFFYGGSTVYRTLCKVEAGYTSDDGTEYPTNSTLFVGLIGGNIEYPENNLVSFKCDHISKVFQEFNADYLGFSGNYTASRIVEKIRDWTDTNTVAYFQKYISTGAWTIDATTHSYNIETTTSLEDYTVWEYLQLLAEAENYSFYIDRDGSFYFQQKAPLTSTVQFHFSGLNDTDKTYGMNIMKSIKWRKNTNKIYNRIRVKHIEDDTSTSYETKSENWSWGDSTSSWLYGVRTYELENTFLNTVTAGSIASNIYNEYVNPKKEVNLNSKFTPQLNLNDRISLTYKTKKIEGGDIWGYFNWGHGFWGRRLGHNINFEDDEFRITKMTHNIDKFYSSHEMREI
ncbi:MAG: hypothetical protein GY853_02315 [PVC group bacterium]|nr:hypothetical protein [PVC group bacterium]